MMALPFKRANLEEKEAGQLNLRAWVLKCIKPGEAFKSKLERVDLTCHIYKRKLTDITLESSGKNSTSTKTAEMLFTHVFLAGNLWQVLSWKEWSLPLCRLQVCECVQREAAPRMENAAPNMGEATSKDAALKWVLKIIGGLLAARSRGKI